MLDLAALLLAIGVGWLAQAHIPALAGGRLMEWLDAHPIGIDLAAAACVAAGIALAAISFIDDRGSNPPVALHRPLVRLSPPRLTMPQSQAPRVVRAYLASVSQLPSDASELTMASDRIWMTAYLTGVMTAASADDGQRLAQANLGFRPWNVSYEYGDLWVTTYDAVWRVDAHTGLREKRVALPGNPTDVTAVAGHLWTATSSITGAWLYEIDRTTMQVTFREALGGTPDSVEAGYGMVWLTVRTGVDGHDELEEIDPRTGAVLALAPVVDGVQAGITFAGDRLWLTPAFKPVQVVDPTATTSLQSLPIQPPTDLVASRGLLWTIGDANDSLTDDFCVLSEIDPLTITVLARFRLPEGCDSIAATPDGSLWIADISNVTSRQQLLEVKLGS